MRLCVVGLIFCRGGAGGGKHVSKLRALLGIPLKGQHLGRHHRSCLRVSHIFVNPSDSPVAACQRALVAKTSAHPAARPNRRAACTLGGAASSLKTGLLLGTCKKIKANEDVHGRVVCLQVNPWSIRPYISYGRILQPREPGRRRSTGRGFERMFPITLQEVKESVSATMKYRNDQQKKKKKKKKEGKKKNNKNGSIENPAKRRRLKSAWWPQTPWCHCLMLSGCAIFRSCRSNRRSRRVEQKEPSYTSDSDTYHRTCLWGGGGGWGVGGGAYCGWTKSISQSGPLPPESQSNLVLIDSANSW